MASFRSFLARERLVPIEQLDRALQRQILYGDDLAVNLLEIGAVDEDELTQFLGLFHRLPIVTRQDLDSAPAEVVRLVPEHTALGHRVCPVAVADEAMVVAAVRPLGRNVVDELARLTGHSIATAVCTPLTLAWGLATHYGVEYPARYRRIDAALRRRQAEPREAGAGQAGRERPREDEVPPREPQEPEEAGERRRRGSGIIVLPGDLPESERGVEGGGEVRATASATTVPPPSPQRAPSEEAARAPLPVTDEERAADDLLEGITFAERTAADRLYEVVLGPPGPAEDGAAEAEASRGAETEPGPAPGSLAEAAAGPVAVPIRDVIVRGDLAATVSGAAAQRLVPIPAAVKSLIEARPARATMPSPPDTDLLARIARLDTIDGPYEVLRYTFYLFSAAFRCGLLIDATRDPEIREAFGVPESSGSVRGRAVPEGALPQVVLGAAQPLLTRMEEGDRLAAFVAGVFGTPARNALLLPVVVGHRVVAVLYGDNRDSFTSFEQIRELFHVAWAAGERLARIARDRRAARKR